MCDSLIICDSMFDGRRHRSDGPYTIEIAGGRIRAVHAGNLAADIAAWSGSRPQVLNVPFIMPGMVEAHCHLFLDGGELDFNTRKEYLAAPLDQMMQMGHRNVIRNLESGITLIRDAGDIHGVNGRIKAQTAAAAEAAALPAIRSPGKAIRKAKRYGSFMAEETTDPASIVARIRELAPQADDLKILLTGIIDFENGTMKGGVQFDVDEARLIVRTARELGLLTYCHCSGTDGLAIATEAGIDSIEHGFFMEEQYLNVMAEKQIAWVPTFKPVYFQYERPELAGWSETTVAKLWEILDRHFVMIEKADRLGVPIVAGSDAGSYGVPHGSSLVDELLFHHRVGLSVERVLASGTSTPRRLWNCPSADIAAGNRADLIALAGSPFDRIEHLRSVTAVCLGRAVRVFEPVAAA